MDASPNRVDTKVSVIQIVSGLPPLVDGVGDYALNLAQALARNHNIHTHFLACNPAWAGAESVEGFPVHRLGDRTPAALLRALAEGGADDEKDAKLRTVLLHLSPYGYDKNACPFWLVKGLRAWKRESAGHRLVTMFHELYAFGPPWRKAFWQSPFQRRIPSQVVCLSEAAITNTGEYASKLIGWDPFKEGKIAVLPVLSNVGEPKTVPPLHSRSKRMAVFGRAPNRQKVYRHSLTALAKACGMLDIGEIVDIGPPLGTEVPKMKGISLIQRGQIPASEVSALLLDSIAGFVDYEPGRLAKSGIYAAYCSHGLLPVCPLHNPSEADGVYASKHYWIASTARDVLNLESAEGIAKNALAWYAQHDLDRATRIFSGLLASQ